uniref:YqaJ viral recombinase domain-containing protein n=1 Tax=Magallana gigas TaxID=29159 RepID=A0A8W8MHN0_MAGGI
MQLLVSLCQILLGQAFRDRTSNQCEEILRTITVSHEESHNVEKLTREQKTKCFPHQRNNAQCAKRRDTSNQVGKTKEEVALKEYAEMMKIHHPSFSARRSGLMLNPHYPTLGASPDAVTDCMCCGKGLVEIKCPFKIRDTNPCEVNTPNFYLRPHA